MDKKGVEKQMTQGKYNTSEKTQIRNKLDFIFNHFGQKNQVEKLKEECLELIEQIDKLGDITNTTYLPVEFLAEVVDVMVVSHQFYQNYNRECNKLLDYKINRTVDRIHNDYYKRSK